MISAACHFTAVSTTVIYASDSSRRQSQPARRKQPAAPKPSLYEMERAIGAGSFRDRDTSEPLQKDSFFDKVLANTIGRTEGPAERQLREAGEWLSQRTERASRSSSTVKNILVVMFLWVLPAWLLSLFVASGTVTLPFSFPALEDLIM